MAQRKKLNLKELELQLPPIESNETRIILGGNDYGGEDSLFHLINEDVDTLVHIVENCVDGNNVGGNNPGNDNYQDEGDFDHYYDHDDGNGYNDYDNAGDGDTTGDSYNDHQGLDYIKPFDELPHLEQQASNYCSAYSMEFIKEMITGIEIPDTNSDFINQVADYYHQVSNEWMFVNGLNSDYTQQVIDHFFTYGPVNGLQSVLDAIDQNHPIFATLDFGDPNPNDNDPTHDGHAVVIVGYDYDNNLFIYADPATGQYGTTDGSNFIWDYSFAITGVKP